MNTLQKALFSSISRNKNKNALWINNKYYTYKKLNDLSEKYRKVYSRSNSNLVCILLEKNIYCYACILAIAKDGRTYVPLNPKFPVEKNRKIFSTSGAQILLVESQFIDQVKHIVGSKNKKKILIVVPDKDISSTDKSLKDYNLCTKKDFNSKVPRLPVFKKTTPKSDCYILFTSGSTGVPKGVPINNKNVISYLKSSYDRYKPNSKDKFSHNFELTFDLSIHDIFLCWISGSCLYVTPKNQLLNPGHFIKKHRLTMWFSVPSLGLHMHKMKILKKNAFPSLKQTIFCGEALPYSLVNKWFEAAPNSIIDNLYGPTETTIAILAYRLKKNQSEKECVNGIVPIGIPFKGQKADYKKQKFSESNQTGELSLSGSQIFRGYLKNKKETNLKFYKTENKIFWYRTGDLVKKNSNGNYVYLGRIDRQIKVRGFRVETQEVENLLKKITRTNYSAVIGWPPVHQSNFSYENTIAFLLRQLKMKNHIIINKLRKKLPYYAIPERIIRLKNFPLNSNGKIDYNELLSIIQK